MAIELRHATKGQLVAAFRARYRDSTAEETLRLAEWCITHLDAGDLNDAELRAAFGMTMGAWTSLKARMKTHSDNRKSIKAARGE